MTTRVGEGVRLIEKKNYATILCLLTFTICVMPFYSIQEHAFKRALIRISNVLIGCILGVGMSMLVFPKPSVNILVDNISKQIILAGESSQLFYILPLKFSQTTSMCHQRQGYVSKIE